MFGHLTHTQRFGLKRNQVQSKGNRKNLQIYFFLAPTELLPKLKIFHLLSQVTETSDVWAQLEMRSDELRIEEQARSMLHKPVPDFPESIEYEEVQRGFLLPKCHPFLSHVCQEN